jgi:hypothetical protein
MFMNVAANATSYPTDGKGAVSTTAASSHVLDRPCELLAVTFTAAVAGTITIGNHTGGESIALVVSATTPVPSTLNFPRGTHVTGPGIRAVSSAGSLTAIVHYRPIL